MDLLDDWTLHPSFRAIRGSVDESYRIIFGEADAIYANSEGTCELARRFGRNDVILMPNGCDPAQFSSRSRASGPTKIGYIGKIGHRLDFPLIERVASQFSSVNFIFIGPLMSRDARRVMSSMPSNVEHLGDVPYPKISGMLESFDIGWIPHSVGQGEIGGDAIKLYEYRAAGLPVLTTDIIGVRNRGLDEVHVGDADFHVSWLCEVTRPGNARVSRVSQEIPEDLTWEYKAKCMLTSAGLWPL